MGLILPAFKPLNNWMIMNDVPRGPKPLTDILPSHHYFPQHSYINNLCELASMRHHYPRSSAKLCVNWSIALTLLSLRPLISSGVPFSAIWISPLNRPARRIPQSVSERGSGIVQPLKALFLELLPWLQRSHQVLIARSCVGVLQVTL